MKLIWISLKSAWNRKFTISLTVLSIAISIFLLLGVDSIRKGAKNSFINTISQTDLIVGARGGPINLLLYSIFRIGNATNNVSWESFRDISSFSGVDWAVPISLGDSHRGFRVMGTTEDYFKHYRYANNQKLEFEAGSQFEEVYDVVLGFDVARRLKYKIGNKIIISHGLISANFADHADKPFTVTGVLKGTGTPVDRTIHISLEGMEAIHSGWETVKQMELKKSNVETSEKSHDHSEDHGGEESREHLHEKSNGPNVRSGSITAFMLGLTNRIDTLRLQRKINEYDEEPLQAVVPAAALAELWQIIGGIERILLIISTLVLTATLIGMLTTILSTLNERRREMAILRAVGAHPYHIILLFALETFFVVSFGSFLGIVSLYLFLRLVGPLLMQSYGISFVVTTLDVQQLLLIAGVVFAGVMFSLIPGFIAYRRSLQDGLMVKV